MRKLKLYIATSLNGMIARQDGSVDWLDKVPNPQQSDYGYADFYGNTDTTIQGYNTYKDVMKMGVQNPYPYTRNYVFTSDKGRKPTSGFEFVTENHIEFTKQLKAGDGKDIWLIGGGRLNTSMLENDLIDEILMFVMPVIIADGIRLFSDNNLEKSLVLSESVNYSSGVIGLKYLLS